MKSHCTRGCRSRGSCSGTFGECVASTGTRSRWRWTPTGSFMNPNINYFSAEIIRWLDYCASCWSVDKNECPLLQVGTTSWLADFLLMSNSRSLLERGRISGTKIHEIVKETFKVSNMTPQQLRWIVNWSLVYWEHNVNLIFSQLSEDSNSFSVVRHPFVRCVNLFIFFHIQANLIIFRLVSAFQDARFIPLS